MPYVGISLNRFSILRLIEIHFICVASMVSNLNARQLAFGLAGLASSLGIECFFAKITCLDL
jgi:hypothetical protein